MNAFRCNAMARRFRPLWTCPRRATAFINSALVMGLSSMARARFFVRSRGEKCLDEKKS